MRIASSRVWANAKGGGTAVVFEKKARTRTFACGATLVFHTPLVLVVTTVKVFHAPAGLPLTSGRVCTCTFALRMAQPFFVNDPLTAAAAAPRTRFGLTVIDSTGLFAGLGQPPLGAACDGSAGAISSPPAMATVETIWRARIRMTPLGSVAT